MCSSIYTVEYIILKDKKKKKIFKKEQKGGKEKRINSHTHNILTLKSVGLEIYEMFLMMYHRPTLTSPFLFSPPFLKRRSTT